MKAFLDSEPRFKIGDAYADRNKRVCTIVDILKTFNSGGDLVDVRYVSQHMFLGQSVTTRDVLDITIARALITGGAK